VLIQTGSTASLFYNAYGMSFAERQCVQQISEIVKKCCPNSKSVIGYYDVNATPVPGIDSRTYDWRLLDYLKCTDWIIDLNPPIIIRVIDAASVKYKHFVTFSNEFRTLPVSERFNKRGSRR
jgi:hypothetical protein